MLTFHFGIPDVCIIEEAHLRDIAVGITATCPAEAQRIEAAGADFVVAQGWEAGGHRGCFDADAADTQLATAKLIPAIRNRTNPPIVAAGGLMNGQDIRRMISAGAAACQLGTAFLCCDEAGTPQSHHALLLDKPPRATEFTRGFSGRPAREIFNQVMQIMRHKSVRGFPLQNTTTSSIRGRALQANDPEFQGFWA